MPQLPSPGAQSVADAIQPPLYPDWAQNLLANPVSASLQPQAALMTPTDPSWARKLGDWAAQASGGRVGAQRLSDFVTNTAGMVPGVGAATAGNEARQDWNQGDYAGAGLNLAMGMIPGAAGAGEKTAAKVLEEAAAKPILDMGEQAAPRIIAYHGSPHTFDQFDISKIGTGEGAQMYGHGLYFAQNEDVAKSYRDTLGANQRSWYVDGDKVGQYGGNSGPLGSAAARVWQQKGADGVVTKDDINGALARFDQVVDKSFGGVYPDADKIRSAISALEGRTVTQDGTGSMYQVSINADPAHFLDWDKPLSEQPHLLDQVKAALPDHPTMDAWKTNGVLENAPFASIYKGATDAGTNRAIAEGKTQQFSEALRAAGIPGIKYLDAGSRGGGGAGTHNYVVFDDKTIDILKRYGLAGLGLAGAGAVAPQMMQQQQPQGGT